MNLKKKVPNEFEMPFRNLFKWTNRSSILNHLNSNSNSTDQLINNIKNQSKEVIKTLKKEYNYSNMFNRGIKSTNSSTELNNSITKLTNSNGNSTRSSKRNKKKK